MSEHKIDVMWDDAHVDVSISISSLSPARNLNSGSWSLKSS